MNLKNIFALLTVTASLVSLTGCSSPYVITTRDGTAIVTDGKPKLDKKAGLYKYEDSEGRDGQVTAQDVKQVIECGD